LYCDFYGFDLVLRMAISNLLYRFWVKPLQKCKQNASAHSPSFPSLPMEMSYGWKRSKLKQSVCENLCI